MEVAGLGGWQILSLARGRPFRPAGGAGVHCFDVTGCLTLGLGFSKGTGFDSSLLILRRISRQSY
jgi:hypothetical protein